MLRSIRRYVVKEFKKDNKKLVKKRYKQVEPMEMFSGFLKTWKRILPDYPDIDTMTQFVMIFSGICSSHAYPYEESIKAKGDQIAKVMQLFVSSQFEELFEIKELEVLFNTVLKNSPEDMYKPCREKYQSKMEACVSMIDQWKIKFAISQNEHSEADH